MAGALAGAKTSVYAQRRLHAITSAFLRAEAQKLCEPVSSSSLSNLESTAWHTSVPRKHSHQSPSLDGAWSPRWPLSLFRTLFWDIWD